MLKPASLLLTAILGASTLLPATSQQDIALSKRVQELEQWRATADARIQALEGLLKAKGQPAAAAPSNAAARVLSVTILNKRFDPSNPGSRKYEDNIWWDAEYTATGLAKPARSIKGVLKFCDLFGDPRFQVRVTLDDPIAPKAKVSVQGVGIQYNQFLDTHKWLRSTELSNMTFTFEAETVLYEDGTSERFGS
jgi:hypothetical protein